MTVAGKLMHMWPPDGWECRAWAVQWPPPLTVGGGDCSWCFPGTVHLVLQEEARAAASTGGISTGWPRKHIAIVAAQIFSVNKWVQNNWWWMMFYPHNLQHWTIVSHHKKVCSTFNYWQCDNSASITHQCNYRYIAMTSCAVIFFKALQIKHGSWWIIHTSTINKSGHM